MSLPDNILRYSLSWSLKELDILIEALQRDHYMTVPELHKYVGTKSAEEINLLIKSLMATKEEDIMNTEKLSDDCSFIDETSLDIVQQCLKCLTPPPFDCSTAVSEALSNISTCSGSNKTDNSYSGNLHSKRIISEPNFKSLYNYIASLFESRKLEMPDGIDATIILDMLICLISMVDVVRQASIDSASSPGSDLDAGEGVGILRAALNGITQKAGFFLATLVALRDTNNLLCPHFRGEKSWSLRGTASGVSSSRDTNPRSLSLPAPACLHEASQTPPTLMAASSMSQALLAQLLQVFNLPTLSKKLDLKDSNSFDAIFRRITRFVMNPFSLSINQISPLQRLVSTSDLLSGFYKEALTSYFSRSSKVAHVKKSVNSRSRIQATPKFISGTSKIIVRFPGRRPKLNELSPIEPLNVHALYRRIHKPLSHAEFYARTLRTHHYFTTPQPIARGEYQRQKRRMDS